MIRENVTADDAINLLNELLRIDKKAVEKVVFSRVECNEKVANHKSVQVGINEDDGGYEIGLLGILNGIFGVDSCGYGVICVEMTAGSIVRFRKLNV
jgi:hypothetical protein